MATIGVIGHRVLSDLDRVEAGIAQAIRKLSDKFQNERMTLLTSLAEGSDRLVMKQFQSVNFSRIVAVLPLKPQDYLTDFSSPQSRKEFAEYIQAADEIVQMPDFPDRESAYEAAALYVVDHCDALICIWDGQAAHGRGGTGAMAERARKSGLPLVWIHAGNRQPGTMNPTTLGTEQGTITYENF